MSFHPLDILQGYRLGSRQATVELQKPGVPGIHIPFPALDLIDRLAEGYQELVALFAGSTYRRRRGRP
jgi:hypothetical protein